MFSNNTLVSICIGVIIAIICAITVYIKTRRDENNREMADNFLNGLADNILNSIITIIHQVDPKEFKNVEDFEKAILAKVYETIWDYTLVKTQEAYYDKTIVKAVLNIIDKQFVLDFIDGILAKKDIYEIIRSTYAAPVIESGEMESEDEKLIKEFSNQEEYFEVVEPCDLPPVEVVELDDSNLNPQKDDGEPISDDDTSIEEITSNSVIMKKDKNNNTLYYILDENKKMKRIGKEEAKLLGYVED